jgi:hypothetical protein
LMLSMMPLSGWPGMQNAANSQRLIGLPALGLRILSFGGAF